MHSSIYLRQLYPIGLLSLTVSSLARAQTPPAPDPAAPATPVIVAPAGPPAPSPAAAPADPSEVVATPASDPAATEAPVSNPAATPEALAPSESPSVLSAPQSEASELPVWLEHFKLGGGLILYYYQPTEGDGKNNVSVFFASLLLDADWDGFGLHIEPRFRDTRLRSYFDGPVWLQEAYASAALGPVTIKLGKSYKRLGLFWDNSFYGNVQVYDGLKLDPNYGVSIEGAIGGDLGLDFSAQYFIVDGGTNVSLANRDTLYIPGARRRDTFVGRVAPTYDFDGGSAQLGISAEHFSADLPGGESGVTRLAADAKVTYAGLGVWAEFLTQDGRHVTDFPYAGTTGTPPAAGRASGDNRYLLLGGEYAIGPVALRYNVSFGDYRDVDVSEVMHVPAVGFKFNEHLSILGEYVHWTRDTPEGDVDVDKSVNVTVNGFL